jgi:hypothetical protein
MPDLLAAPFLGQYLLLRPGSTNGVQLPRGHFDQLVQAAAEGGSHPSWLAELVRQTWHLNLPDTAPINGRVLGCGGPTCWRCSRRCRRTGW